MSPISDSSWRPSTRSGKRTIRVTDDGPIEEKFVDALAALKAMPSPALERVLGTLGRLAKHNTAPILLVGESGVGKTLLAQAVHQLSRRAREPFVSGDFTAMRGDLAMSQLFGHVRGAFTGADRSRVGAMRLAHRGTLFLDELAKAELDVQSLLLTCSESGRITPVGSDRPLTVDVRFVFATNRPLAECIEQGIFLPDLAARITHFAVRIPPVRERMEDVEFLVKRAIALATRGLGLLRAPTVSDELMEVLMRHTWPENVREILGTIERIAAEANGAAVLRPAHVPAESPLAKLVARRGRPRLRRGDAAAAVEAAAGNKTEAARLSNVHRSTIHRRLKRDEAE